MPKIELLQGDCLEHLDQLPENYFDSAVIDAPYHFASIVKRFGAENAAPARVSEFYDGDGDSKGSSPFVRSSAGFMGKTWDGGDIAFQPETWRKVLRVLKPGAHLLAFGAPKNYHHLAMAIEMAGFEMRDALLQVIAANPAISRFLGSLNETQVDAFIRVLDDSQFGGAMAWLFGSGFPKNHNISKALDRRRDWSKLEALQHVIRDARKALGISQSEAARRALIIGPNEKLGGGGFMWYETGRRMPTRLQWMMIKQALCIAGAEFDDLFEEAERQVIGQHRGTSSAGGFGDHRFKADSKDITAPATEAALQWAGWGTALKPGYEPIVMARKPTRFSTAENIMRLGCGGINIDGCRIEIADRQTYERNASGDRGHDQNRTRDMDFAMTAGAASDVGRWPANLMHDGSAEALSVFPDNAGAFAGVAAGQRGKGSTYGTANPNRESQRLDDLGSAARFFYSPKADDVDRWGTKHPTVKPVDLIAYLCRLVTPPGGRVLDCFAGSGTTGEACHREGFDCVMIEREPEYCADILARLERLRGDGRHSLDIKARHADPETSAGADLPLFSKGETE